MIVTCTVYCTLLTVFFLGVINDRHLNNQCRVQSFSSVLSVRPKMITKNLFVSFRREISIIRKKSAILSGLAALEYTSIPILLSVITLLLTGQPLTPVNTFMLLMFTNLLRSNICLDIAYGVVETRESFASLGRIEDFLISEDLFSISEDHCLHDRETVAERKSGKLQNDFTSMSQSHVLDEDPFTDQWINPS